MSREFKARAKTFNKMTRSGLTERNAVTGAEKSISAREHEIDLRDIQPDDRVDGIPINAAKKTIPKKRYYQRVNEEPPPQTENRHETRYYEPPPIQAGKKRKRRARYKRPEQRTVKADYGNAAAPEQTQKLDINKQPVSSKPGHSILPGAVNRPKRDNWEQRRSFVTEPPQAEKPSILNYRQSEQPESAPPHSIAAADSKAASVRTDKSGKYHFSKAAELNPAKGKNNKNRDKRKKRRGGDRYPSQLMTEAVSHQASQEGVAPRVSQEAAKFPITQKAPQHEPPKPETAKQETPKQELREITDGSGSVTETVQTITRDTHYETEPEKPLEPDVTQVIQNGHPPRAPDVIPGAQKPRSDSKLRFNRESKLNLLPTPRASPRKKRKRKGEKAEHAARYEPPVSTAAIKPSEISEQTEQSADTNKIFPERPKSTMEAETLRPFADPSELAAVPGEIIPEKLSISPDAELSKLRDKTAKLNINSGKTETVKDHARNGDEPAKAPLSEQISICSDNDGAAPGEPMPDKKLARLKNKAERYDSKLEKARGKLPSKTRLKAERTFDESKGKPKTKFRFEKELLPPGSEYALPEAVQKGSDNIKRIGAQKLHQKIYEVEDENAGTKAAHRVEQAAESIYRSGKRATRLAFSHIRDKPYRTVEKLENKAAKANAKYSFRKALSDNPGQRGGQSAGRTADPKLKSNIFSRFMQKRKIKQEYAKAARETKNAGTAIKKTGDITAKAAKAAVTVIKSHPIAAAVIIIILLLIFFAASLFSAFGSMAGASLPAIMASSYLAENTEIDAAELNYTEWETDLLFKINRIEQDYPGFDEYRVQAGDIGHNPYELMAFLTAAYQDFQYADIETLLREIFNEQYVLTVDESVETRYYEDEDGEPIPYDWRVLTVSLAARSFTDVISPRLNTEQAGIYALLTQTKGNRQYADSPFNFNWLPNVTSYYGYRIHPISGEKDYHKGIDIAVPVGTDIRAGHDGTVTFAGYSGSYGYVVTVEDSKGVVTKYAHCDSLAVSAGQEVKRGDVIAESGNTGDSTGPHLHMEVLKDGEYLNPLYFVSTNDTGVPEPVYGYAGAPMGNGSYAALIEEAEKHLGKSYVFGANGPDNFDCSSFVCWTLTQSGAASIGRTTAQGLYNLSNPVQPGEAEPGDLVFFSGTYSTTNTVTHVGIYVGGGMMVHAGDPVQYTSINTNYWQSHLYAFGRIN